jgi:hypothetical protein
MLNTAPGGALDLLPIGTVQKSAEWYAGMLPFAVTAHVPYHYRKMLYPWRRRLG